MNFMPESTAGTSRNRDHQIITGTRTDHHRPCSPTSSSCSGDADSILCYHKANQPPTTMSTEEDEDMANCLIMLAQSESPIKEYESDLYCHKNDKLKLRSVTEMLADETAGGSSVCQSYECKTCNRAFQSFQALGGHRASHKKPKFTTEDKISAPAVETDQISKEDKQKLLVVNYEESKISTNSNNKRSSSSLAVTGFIQTGYKNCKGKIHECSICGSEFLSGQALGGHMRRHRTPPASINSIAVLTNLKDSSGHHITGKSRVLSLDLNLPAPEVIDDDNDGPSNFQFTSSSSQKPLVFSAAALVDCHY